VKKVTTLILAFSLFGCAGQKIILENSVGKQVTCEVSTGSAMLTGTLMRDAKMKRCVRNYEAQGYTNVIEAEQKI
jgi:hypothetical protein